MLPNWRKIEQELEDTYVNKVVTIQCFTKSEGMKSYTGKVDRLSLDNSTRNPPIVIFVLDAQNRFEVEYDDLYEVVTKLN